MANFENTDAKLSTHNAVRIDCSVVVPLYNESAVVQELYDRLTKTLTATGLYYELIFIDDGSSDNTLQLLKSIASKDSKVLVVELRRNFGKSAAYAAGFDNAKGRIVVTMDGDLQHLPEDIPRFIEKIEDGYDVVCSWRQRRVDNLVMRRIPSKAANWLASKISGVDIHDFGGGFKAYKREIIKELNLYGEMQRFIPALVSQRGAKIAEIPIKNIPRPYGTSRYGISRIFQVAFDLVTIRFLLEYITRPLYFFGKATFYCVLASILMAGYILFDKLYYKVPILVAHGPMAGLAAVLLMVGTVFIATGLIGEMISRVYFESTGKKIYSVKKIHTRQTLGPE
ncbi:MAG: glycosyltransferase family 2 protein [Sedimentisphaerales bacterium]|jgi:glycosyltransferase involved in cell wall biosynthesis